MSTVLEIAGRRVLLVGEGDPILRTTGDVTDLVGEGMGEGARLIAVPVEGLDPSFFQLRSGFAGEVLQKLANYRFGFAVLGDISAYVEASTAFRDLVREAGHNNAVFFVADLDALTERLAAKVETTGRF